MTGGMKRALVWLPLALFTLLLAVAIYGLRQDGDRSVRSAMVGRALPAFALPPMVPGKPGLTRADFVQGKPRLINVFASWCVPCAAEAAQLARLKAAGVAIDAVAIRDRSDDVTAFLARNGDPFAAIGSDPESAFQLALGSSGVPETFVIDGRGRVAHQHIGEIREEDVPVILAALERAK